MPTIQDSISSIVPAGVDVAQWLATRGGLNSATSTINQGANTASAGLGTASQAAIDAQNKALQEQQGLYQTTVDANKPYQATGETGNAQLQGLIQDPNSLSTTPGYQFELGQGLQGGQRAAAASGTLGNGGTIKAQTRYALDYANTKYNDAVQRLLQVTNVGQTANAADQAAGTTLGNQIGTGETNIGNFGTRTAEDQASLTLAQAQLNATNQVAQSQNTSNLIKGVAPTIASAAQKLLGGPSTPTTPASQPPLTNDQSAAGFVGPATPTPDGFVGPTQGIAQAGTDAASAAAPTIAGAAGAAGAGAAAAGTDLGAVAAGAVPELAAPVEAIGASEGALAGIDSATIAANEAAVGTGAVSSGALATVSSLLTNPITIGIGAAIGAALIWKATQVHPTADTFVQKFQNPFGQKLGAVVDSFDKALSTGQLTKAQAQTAYQQTAGLIQSFETDRTNFAAKGSKEATVAKQAEQTMVQNFGPNYDKILGKMESEINSLPDTAAA